jgi:protein-S-isoprenylcysteine O-methyltransferase Ste14
VDAVRYWLALLLIVFVPPAFCFWFSIHPFIKFWRRVGARWALAIHYVAALALAGCIFAVRKPILAVDFGTNPVLIALGVPILAAAIVMRRRVAKHLKYRILTGVPELSVDSGGELLTEGLYAKIRHPRYVEILVGVFGYALIANYLAGYLLWLLCLPVVYLITVLEERELVARFGEQYGQYRARVPRFIPKF